MHARRGVSQRRNDHGGCENAMTCLARRVRGVARPVADTAMRVIGMEMPVTGLVIRKRRRPGGLGLSLRRLLKDKLLGFPARRLRHRLRVYFQEIHRSLPIQPPNGRGEPEGQLPLASQAAQGSDNPGNDMPRLSLSSN